MAAAAAQLNPRDVCIVGVARTPIGGFLGALSSLPATKLGSIAIESALRRANVDPASVQEVYFGNVLSSNLGQAPARQAALGAGIPNTVICTTINKVCSSGMKATMIAAQSIQLGINDIVVSGGMESMSNAPKYFVDARKGSRFGNDTIIDGMLKDGLWDVYNDFAMGMCGELCSDQHSISRDEQDSKQLTVKNVKTLKMNDDVLAMSISPEGKYIAVALLDCTVRVFFLDSLKFFLSLYGHKLPVLCMDISSDGDLIVTGSADKNLKIWGLDFGDCHKSLFAHSDSVMDVKFVKNTHYMFSVGKDRLIKYWDADKFELLLTLEGHHAEVWCLAISTHGGFFITGSHDRSIRRWDRTEEPFFLEEEREKRLQEMFESDLETNENKYAPREELPEEGSVAVPGKKTQETITAMDMIIDALDTAEAELKRIDEYNADKQNGKAGQLQPNVLMRGLSPADYVLQAVSTVRANDLEPTLLSLPYSDALKVISYLKGWVQKPDKVELVCRITTVLLQTHHCQLTTTPAARPVLTILKDILHAKVKACKDTIGFNLAAMDHLKEMMSMRSDAPFRDAKSKLMEIRLELSKRSEKFTEGKRRKKKQKNSSTNQPVPS